MAYITFAHFAAGTDSSDLSRCGILSLYLYNLLPIRLEKKITTVTGFMTRTITPKEAII